LKIEKAESMLSQKQPQLVKVQISHEAWLEEPKAPKEDEQPNLVKSSEQ